MAQTNHRATSRVLDIFDLLSTTTTGFTLTEIAQSLDSPKSSILPMLQTLVARGYINLDYRTNRYTIGMNLFLAGSIYRGKVSVNCFIDMEMKYLSRHTGEACTLAVLDNQDTFFIHCTDPEDIDGQSKRPGSREPAYLGALGKSLLCDYKLDELVDLFFKENGRLAPQTNLYHTHIQMEETRYTALSYEYGEVDPSIQCVASPIRYQKKVVAAIGIILPVFRINPQKVLDCTKMLPVSAQRIENVLANSEESPSEVFSLNGFKNL